MDTTGASSVTIDLMSKESPKPTIPLELPTIHICNLMVVDATLLLKHTNHNVHDVLGFVLHMIVPASEHNISRPIVIRCHLITKPYLLYRTSLSLRSSDIDKSKRRRHQLLQFDQAVGQISLIFLDARSPHAWRLLKALSSLSSCFPADETKV